MADIAKVTIQADASQAKKAARTMDGLAGSARKTGRTLRGYSTQADKAGKETKGLNTAANRLRSTFGVLSAGIAGIGFVEMARQIERATTQMNNIEATMRVATGSAEAAGQQIAFIRAESERLGLFFPSVAKQMAQFSAAARTSSITGSELRSIFTGISEASRAMGLTAPQAEGAMMALQQMMSKGKVSAEELRQQLGERMPGSIQIMADALDVTTSKLFEMMENGRLLSDEVLPKFGRELQSVFGGEAAEQADRIAASIQRFRNSLFNLLAQDDLKESAQAIDTLAVAISSEDFQEGFDTAVSSVSKLGAVLAENLNNITTAVTAIGGFQIARRMAGGVSSLTGTLTSLVGQILPTTAATVALTGKLQVLQAVLLRLAGPAGVLVAGLAILYQWREGSENAGEATKRWRQETEDLRDSIENLSAAQNLDIMENAREAASNITDIREEIKSLEETVAGFREQGIPITSTEEGRRLNRLRADLRAAEAALETYATAQDNFDTSRANAQAAAIMENQKAAALAAKEIEEYRQSLRDLADEMLDGTRQVDLLPPGQRDELASSNAEMERIENTLSRINNQSTENSNVTDVVAQSFIDLKAQFDSGAQSAVEYRDAIMGFKEQLQAGNITLQEYVRLVRLAADAQNKGPKTLEDYERIAGEMGIGDQREVDLLPPGARDNVAAANAELEQVRNNLDLLDDNDAAENLKTAFEQVADTLQNDISNGLTDIIMQAEDAKDVFVGLANQIARTITQQQISNPIAQGITDFAGGLDFGSLFGGGGGGASAGVAGNVPMGPGRANGGNVYGDTAHMVGERGPEMFIPRQDGQIVPNSQMGGGGGDVTVNIINQSGEQLQSEQQNKRRGPNGEMTVDVMVKSSMERLDSQGQLDGIFRRHGAKRQGQF